MIILNIRRFSMNTNLISVIVPCYNAAGTIGDCVASLLASEGVTLQIILANDGSEDGTGEICEELARTHENVKHLALDHKGVAATRNAALSYAEGDYIGFADSDDHIEPDMFAKLLKPLAEGEGLISVCGFFREASTYKDTVCYPEGFSVPFSEFRKKLFSDERTEGFLFNKLFPASLIKERSFNESLTHCEDLCFIFSLEASDDARVVYIPEALYHYIQSDSSLTGGRSFFRDGTFLYAPAFRIFEKSNADKSLLGTIRVKYCKILQYSMSVVMTTGDSHPVHTPEDLNELRRLRRELRRSLLRLHPQSLPVKRWLSLCKSAYYPLTALIRKSDERRRRHSAG